MIHGQNLNGKTKIYSFFLKSLLEFSFEIIESLKLKLTMFETQVCSEEMSLESFFPGEIELIETKKLSDNEIQLHYKVKK